MCLICVAGFSYSVSVKWQNETPGYQGLHFDHAYFQTLFLSIGKSLALVVYAAKKVIYKEKKISLTSRKMNEAINSD